VRTLGVIQTLCQVRKLHFGAALDLKKSIRMKFMHRHVPYENAVRAYGAKFEPLMGGSLETLVRRLHLICAKQIFAGAFA